jgi:hypothetical protein
MKSDILKLIAQRDNLDRKIKEYQEKCIHSNIEVISKSNTKNYDVLNDEWWIENKCQDCGKFWISEIHQGRY